jgi:peroxiredoxin
MAVFCAATASTAALKEGDRAPDLHAFKLEGAVPDTRRQVVLLDFWASWCAPCKASFPEMEKLYKLYGQRGFTIVAVSVDEKRENMDRFVRSMKSSFPVVRDADQKLVAAADVQTMPTSFLIDRSGRVRFVHSGFRGDQTVKEYRQEIETLLKEPAP